MGNERILVRNRMSNKLFMIDLVAENAKITYMSKTEFQYKNIGSIIRREVIVALREIIDDSDFGLEFTEKAKRRLKQAISSKGRKKGTSLSEIKRKYY